MSTQKRQKPTETAQLTGDGRNKSDAWYMRKRLGLSQFEPEQFDYENLAPAALPPHTWEGGRETPSGGTDALVIGPPGAGKSTLAANIAHISVDAMETAVWRGSPSRSEWLPFADVSRVCLPESVRGKVTARWQPRDPTRSASVADLEEVVREVVYYDDPIDLWSNKLLEGGLNIVYPDPMMVGLNRVLDRSERTYEFDFEATDPPVHWWIGAFLARVGPHTPNIWTNVIFDEVGDLAPEHASQDVYSTFDKVQLYRDVYADFRKFGVSQYSFGHVESDIHHLLRHKIRWRITMNGTANPTNAGKVVGFEKVPMRTDLTSRLPVGECLLWNEQNFELVSWSDVSSSTSDTLLLEYDLDDELLEAGGEE